MDVLTEYNQKKEKLKEECEELRSRIEDLEELEKIQGLARKHDITANKLDMIIENQLKLEHMKFTPQAAEILAMELAKIPMTPKRASEIIASILVKYGELNNVINSLEDRIEAQKKIIERERNLLDSLSKEVEEKNSLVEQMERTRETRMQEIRSEYESLTKKLEEEYTRRKGHNLRTKSSYYPKSWKL